MADAKVNITPLGDRVLLKEIEEDDGDRTTDAGIIIPEQVKEDDGAKRGEVVAIGEGERVDGEIVEPPVSTGDRVLFSWGDQLKVDGVDYHLVKISNLLAVIK